MSLSSQVNNLANCVSSLEKSKRNKSNALLTKRYLVSRCAELKVEVDSDLINKMYQTYLESNNTTELEMDEMIKKATKKLYESSRTFFKDIFNTISETQGTV